MDSRGVGGFPPIAPNAQNLPYSARFEGWRRYIRLGGYGCGLLVAAALTLLNFIDGWNGLVEWAVPLGFAIFCALGLWRLRRPIATFHPDRVEKWGLFGVTVLHRANVLGVGPTVTSRYGSYFDIVSNSSVEPDVRLDGFLREIPTIREWLRGAIDPEKKAKDAERAEILADPRYGATSVERERRLKWANIGAVAFNVACVAAACWLWFAEGLDLSTLTLAFLPLVAGWAIVALSNGLIAWASPSGTRPQVIGALAPPLALALDTALTAKVLETSLLVFVTAAIAVTASIAIYLRLVTSASRLQSAIVSGGLIGFAAYGLCLAMNIALDDAPATSSAVFVLDKREGHGKSSRYYLDLTASDGRPRSEVRVALKEYKAATVGETVCIRRHEGALRLAWFDVEPCGPRGPKPDLTGELRTAEEYIARGDLLLNRREFTAARRDFERAVVLEPKSSLAFANLAVAQAWLGSRHEAISNADTALRLDPRQHIAFHAKAIVRRSEGELDEAEDYLLRAVEIQPQSRFAWSEMMLINQSRKRYREALDDSETLLALGADSAELRARRASFLVALREEARALAEADAWIAREPNDPAGYIIRGGLLVTLNRLTEAGAAFDRAVQTRATSGAYVARARYRARQNPTGALEDLDSALKLEPDSEALRLMHAEVQVRAGRPDTARDEYDVLRRRAAGNPRALNNLCYSQATVRVSLDRALSDCEAALNLVPRAAAILDSKGFVLFLLGRDAEAISVMDSALAVNPRLAPSLFVRGMAQTRSGRLDEGAADLAAAREIAPHIDAQFAEYGVMP